MKRITLTLSLVTLILSGCGDRDGSSNKNSQNGYDTSRVGYGYGDNPYGGGGVSSPGGDLFAGQTVTGSGTDGQLSGGQMQELQGTLSKLPAGGRQQVAYLVNLNLNQCSFPPAGEAAASACRAGGSRGCADLMSGYSAGFFRVMIQKLGLFPSSDMVRQEQNACGSVNMANPTAVQNFINMKKEACSKGDRRACVGLLLFLTRLFLRGLMLALALISA